MLLKLKSFLLIIKKSFKFSNLILLVKKDRFFL